MPLKSLKRYKSRHAPKGSFAAHVLTLMTGTTIAQAIPIAISPILTRLYAPSDFGVFALFSSLVSLVAIIATGRYELAIMLPEDDGDAINLLALSVGISLGVSCICIAMVSIFNSQITALLDNQSISDWLYWIPIAVLLTGIYQALNFWNSRKKYYERLSVSRITQSASSTSINLILGISGIGVGGLILGNIVGQSCATGIMGWQVWRGDKERIELISKESIRRNAKRYRNFPLANLFHAFLDAAQTSGIVFVIAAYYGSGILGFYSFVLRILRTPLNLIGSSVSQVFYQKATETHQRNGDLHILMKKTMYRLTMIALPILIVILAFSQPIFAVCFGEKWREAGVYAQILSPWMFLNFIVSPVSGIYLVVGKQKQAILFAVADLVAKLGSIMWGAYCNNAKYGFMAMSASGVVILTVGTGWIFAITRKRKSVNA